MPRETEETYTWSYNDSPKMRAVIRGGKAVLLELSEVRGGRWEPGSWANCYLRRNALEFVVVSNPKPLAATLKMRTLLLRAHPKVQVAFDGCPEWQAFMEEDASELARRQTKYPTPVAGEGLETLPKACRTPLLYDVTDLLRYYFRHAFDYDEGWVEDAWAAFGCEGHPHSGDGYTFGDFTWKWWPYEGYSDPLEQSASASGKASITLDTTKWLEDRDDGRNRGASSLLAVLRALPPGDVSDVLFPNPDISGVQAAWEPPNLLRISYTFGGEASEGSYGGWETP
jgi:hypothetical protein